MKFHKYFNKNISTIHVLNTDFDTFYSKFPYLCCSEQERIDTDNNEYTLYPNDIINDSLFLEEFIVQKQNIF